MARAAREVSVLEDIPEKRGRGVAAGRGERAREPARETRAAQVREMDPVHEDEDTPWVRGLSMEMPPAKPGMDQRWIATAIMGKEMPTNYRRKLREGWKPVDPSSVSKEWQPLKMDQGKYAGTIMVEGSVLCERPMRISERRAKHFRMETQRRTDAINHDLQKVNTENRNPAFGPIKMASRSVAAREVPIQKDD